MNVRDLNTWCLERFFQFEHTLELCKADHLLRFSQRQYNNDYRMFREQQESIGFLSPTVDGLYQ